MYNHELARESLVDAGVYVGKLLRAIDDILDNFLSGKENVALQELPDMTDGFEWILNVIELTRPTQEELGIEFAGVPQFMEGIKEIVAAFENNDYVLLGDLLNYELKPVIEKWDEQLRYARERLGLA